MRLPVGAIPHAKRGDGRFPLARSKVYLLSCASWLARITVPTTDLDAKPPHRGLRDKQRGRAGVHAGSRGRARGTAGAPLIKGALPPFMLCDDIYLTAYPMHQGGIRFCYFEGRFWSSVPRVAESALCTEPLSDYIFSCSHEVCLFLFDNSVLAVLNALFSDFEACGDAIALVAKTLAFQAVIRFFHVHRRSPVCVLRC